MRLHVGRERETARALRANTEADSAGERGAAMPEVRLPGRSTRSEVSTEVSSKMPAEPRWSVPFPYGRARSIDAMGSVAAPLFAGFAITIAFQVLQMEAALRWPELTVGLLLAGAVCLGACVQFTFRSRVFDVSPSEIEAWWPDADDSQRDLMRREQRHHRREQQIWADRARWAYNVGLLLALGGIWAALVPPDRVSGGRLVVLGVAAAAFAAELTWTIRSLLRARPLELPELP